MTIPEVIRLALQPAAQARDTGYTWLAGIVLSEVHFPEYLSPFADAVYRFHWPATFDGWWALLMAATQVNVVLAVIVAAVAVPLMGLFWSVAGLDTLRESVAIDAWLVSAYPFFFHLLESAGPAENGKLPVLALALLAGMLIVRVLVRRRFAPAPRLVRFATAGGLALAALAVTWNALPQPWRWTPPDQRPNVLLISIDTLRSDHLHCYGYERETSPTIDTLAAEGALFAQMASPSSWTLPAHVTLFTGIPPHHHGVVVDGTKFGPQVTTLTEVLAEEGYQTAGFVSGVYLHPSYGFGQGFETYDHSAAHSIDSVRQITSPTIEKLTTEWFQQRSESDRRKPFFVFLHLFDVHFDFIPPDPFNRMFDPDYEGPVDGRGFISNDIHNPDMDRRDFEHLLALYDGEIRFVDHHIKRVLDYMDSIGELENTVVVVTSDHGEEFFEHGRKGHRMTLFEEVVRVPLIIRYPPRIPAGTVIEDQVRLMDVPATILDLVGAELPPEFGMPHEEVRFRPQNLMHWIERRPRLPSIVSFGELHGTVFSIRTPHLKFVYHPDRDYGRLFDLREDPEELENLYRKRPEEAAALKQEIQSFRDADRRPRPAQPHQADEEQLKRLRSLGYVK